MTPTDIVINISVVVEVLQVADKTAFRLRPPPPSSCHVHLFRWREFRGGEQGSIDVMKREETTGMDAYVTRSKIVSAANDNAPIEEFALAA